MFTAQQYVKAATLEEAYTLNQKRNKILDVMKDYDRSRNRKE